MSCNGCNPVLPGIPYGIDCHIGISVGSDLVVVAIPYYSAIAFVPIGIPPARFTGRFAINRQPVATPERIITDACHAARDFDTRQAAATIKRIRADVCQLTVFAKGYACQVVTTSERRQADACQLTVFAKAHAYQTAATLECRQADACQLTVFAKGHAYQTVAILECRRADACYPVRDHQLCYQFSVQIQVVCIIKRIGLRAIKID